jgi:hypothetical protein
MTIDLNSTDYYLKCNAMKKIGYDVKRYGKRVTLIDEKNPNAEKYADLDFNNIDEALKFFMKNLQQAKVYIAA